MSIDGDFRSRFRNSSSLAAAAAATTAVRSSSTERKFVCRLFHTPWLLLRNPFFCRTCDTHTHTPVLGNARLPYCPLLLVQPRDTWMCFILFCFKTQAHARAHTHTHARTALLRILLLRTHLSPPTFPLCTTQTLQTHLHAPSPENGRSTFYSTGPKCCCSSTERVFVVHFWRWCTFPHPSHTPTPLSVALGLIHQAEKTLFTTLFRLGDPFTIEEKKDSDGLRFGVWRTAPRFPCVDSSSVLPVANTPIQYELRLITDYRTVDCIFHYFPPRCESGRKDGKTGKPPVDDDVL